MSMVKLKLKLALRLQLELKLELELELELEMKLRSRKLVPAQRQQQIVCSSFINTLRSPVIVVLQRPLLSLSLPSSLFSSSFSPSLFLCLSLLPLSFSLLLCQSGLPSITFHFVSDFVFLSFCLSVCLFFALSFFPLSPSPSSPSPFFLACLSYHSCAFFLSLLPQNKDQYQVLNLPAGGVRSVSFCITLSLRSPSPFWLIYFAVSSGGNRLIRGTCKCGTWNAFAFSFSFPRFSVLLLNSRFNWRALMFSIPSLAYPLCCISLSCTLLSL